MRNISRLQSDRALTCSTSRSVRPYVDLFYLFPVVTDVPIYFAYGQCNGLVYSITALLIYVVGCCAFNVAMNTSLHFFD